LYLLDNEKISRKEAVELLKLGDTKTKEIFNKLLKKNLLVRHGQGRSTYYTLK
jgi:ATP-dependent DNA helicase RecG